MSDLTTSMKRAIRRFHGLPKMASEARVDLRTVNALVERGLLRSNGRAKPAYSLTPAGVLVYDQMST